MLIAEVNSVKKRKALAHNAFLNWSAAERCQGLLDRSSQAFSAGFASGKDG